MINIQSQPFRGGMNQDDDLDNLPVNDYELGENIRLGMGDRAFEKLFGTTNLGTVTGTCFGWFKFREFSLIFVEDPSPSSSIYRHQIYKLNSDESVTKVFNHELDIDSSIFLTDCVLANENIAIFSNSVDEVMKVHLEQSELTVNITPPDSISFTGYLVGTLGLTDGFIYIDYPTGYTAGTTCLYLYAIVDSAQLNLPNQYSLLANNKVEGQLVSSTRFVTNIDGRSTDLSFDGDSIGFQYCDFSVDVGYRKLTANDYYLVNTPPLDPPSVSVITEQSKRINNLKGAVFQFQAKYVYYDNSESAWSPISKLVYSDDGDIDNLNNNAISVTIKHPRLYERDNVKEVIFGVIINQGILYEFDRKSTINPSLAFLKTDTDIPISTVFYNDEVKIPVLEDDALSLNDNIPLRSNSIELVDNSVLLLGGNTQVLNPTVIEAEVIPKINSTIIPTQTDSVTAYHYRIDNSNTFTQGSTFGLGDVQITTANNYNGQGKIVDGTGGTDVNIVRCFSNQYRRQRANFDKSGVYLDFSGTQALGTKYKINIRAMTYSPHNKTYGLIYDEENTFLVKTTDVDDLIDEIRTWIKNNTRMNRSFGDAGDTIETDGFGGSVGFAGGVTAKSSGSLQVLSGLQCTHSDPGHYHWNQVGYLSIDVKKVSAINYNINTFKNQAIHPFAIRYYDKFNRIISTNKLGQLDLTNYDLTDTYSDVQIKIESYAPENAVRYDVLYSGNKTFKNILYATVTNAGALSNNSQDIELDLSTYNNFVGASLAYSFTKGDKIKRLYSYDGVGLKYDAVPEEDRASRRVIGESSGTITTEVINGDLFVDNDLVVITTPKLEVDDDDSLYYEIAQSFDIVDRLHQANVRNQSDEATEILAERVLLKDDFTSSDSGTVVFIDIAANPIPDGYGAATTFKILNGALQGEYAIIELTSWGDGGIFDDAGFGYTIDLELTDEALNSYEDNEDIFISWNGATDTLQTGKLNNGAIICIENFGDTYLRYRDSVYNTLVESYSISDKFDSRYWGQGRPATIIKDVANNSSVINYSQPFFTNTTNNGLSTYYSLAFKEYNNTYGDIKGLHEYNDRVIVFHERKVGWVLVKKSETTTADGESIKSLAPDVISSTENYFSYSGGIGNQIHSIVRSENWLYFADPYNGNICRISNSGVDIISNVKMNSYFTNLFKDTTLQIYSTFDADTSTLILHLKSDTINKQLTWSESRDRWISFWDLDCERLLFDRVLFSFKNNRVYKHTTTTYNNAYGSQVTSKITKTFVGDQSLKTWKTLMLDPIWIDTDTITIVNERGQSSTLLATDFEQDGQGFWTNFLQDANTPVVTDPLINGDDLQSKTLTVTLTTSDNGDTRLRSMVVTYESAE